MTTAGLKLKKGSKNNLAKCRNSSAALQGLTIQAVLKSALEKQGFKVLKVLKSNSVEPV